MAATETYYDVAMRRLDRQASLVDALDTKTRSALGAASALVPIFGAVSAAFDRNPPLAAIVLFGIAFGLYLAMVFFVAQASGVSAWSIRPDLATLAGHAGKQNESSIRLWVASECAKSISTNDPKLRRKAFYVDLSIITLVLVTVFLSVAALLQLAT